LIASTASSARWIALGVALLGAAACDEKKATTEKPVAEAGTDKYSTVDPKLEKALQAAAAAASSQGDQGPPPAGIFPAGAAERRHPRGAPTKVDLVAPGAEPRVTLLPDGGLPASIGRASFGQAALEVAMQLGQRTALPTIDFALTLGPSKSEEGAAEWLQADVKRALPAKEQLGELPPGTDKQIATLEGTRVRVALTPDGRESDMQMQLGKGAPPELERLAQNAGEALVLNTVPLPPVPVGVGGQWIAETRMVMQDVEVIAYRAYRVESIEGDRLRLTLDVKAYAANPDARLTGMPPGATFHQFDAEAQGEMELVRGEVVARKSALQERIVIQVEAPGAPKPQALPDPDQPPPGGVLTSMIQGRATFVRGEDLRAAQRP
jgi:hypothetical protein